MIILHGQKGRLKNALARDNQVHPGASTDQILPFPGDSANVCIGQELPTELHQAAGRLPPQTTPLVTLLPRPEAAIGYVAEGPFATCRLRFWLVKVGRGSLKPLITFNAGRPKRSPLASRFIVDGLSLRGTSCRLIVGANSDVGEVTFLSRCSASPRQRRRQPSFEI